MTEDQQRRIAEILAAHLRDVAARALATGVTPEDLQAGLEACRARVVALD
jgi:hypothetical protein